MPVAYKYGQDLYNFLASCNPGFERVVIYPVNSFFKKVLSDGNRGVKPVVIQRIQV